MLKRSEGGPSKLWANGISGDLPIVLVRIDETEDLEIVRELVRAHEYWRMKRFDVDLVIMNERAPSYDQDLQSALEALVRANQARPYSDQEGARGKVFVLRADLVSVEVRSLLQAVARAVLLGRRGTLSEQVKRLEVIAPAAAPPPRRAPAIRQPDGSRPRPALEFFNGLGGFAADGREYVTILGEGQWTPAPWINVVANPSFGFQVSVEGAGYTWSINSRENQITPWSNDPVGDRPGEVIYVRDEDTDELWGPTALPIREEPRALFGSSRPGLQHFRAHLARSFARTRAVRAARRLDQDFALEDSQSLGALAAALGHRLRRMGARYFARRVRAVHRDRDRF